MFTFNKSNDLDESEHSFFALVFFTVIGVLGAYICGMSTTSGVKEAQQFSYQFAHCAVWSFFLAGVIFSTILGADKPFVAGGGGVLGALVASMVRSGSWEEGGLGLLLMAFLVFLGVRRIWKKGEGVIYLVILLLTEVGFLAWELSRPSDDFWFF